MEPEKPPNFSIIEVNLVSAQDLKPVTKLKKMQTYAVLWIDPKKKLTTRIDVSGRNNPTWNDKFIFVIEDQSLINVTSALVIEIYVVRRFRFNDQRIGTVRVLLENLLRGSNRYFEGIRGSFMSCQVRRNSGTPQGIMNIGVVIFDGLLHQVMNEFVGPNSGIDYRELMGGREESVKEIDVSMVDFSVKSAFCGLIPVRKTRRPRKIHHWPLEELVSTQS